jgi:uncharacterized protein YjbI with pentapeptide repeats
LRDAVADAASVGAGLWLSYLFALFYFAVAAGAVTHRDLFLESPVKLPFLNIDLPLKGFFILGPLVFLIVHAYVLLHLVLLADKIGAFHTELQAQISYEDTQARLRRQLPSNIFVQFLSGPPEVRHGIVGFLLKLVAWISLIAGPVALLVLFQLQFLPYHSKWITMWQRLIVVIDLVLLWILWPQIARGEATGLGWRDFKRAQVQAWLLVSILTVLLVGTIATFPGEWLEESLPRVRLIPTTWKAWALLPSVQAIEAPGSGWVSLHELLVGRPQSLWPNVLVLLYVEVGDRAKVDTEGKISISSSTISLRDRSLERAVLSFAHLRKADFTGVSLAGADFGGADLREAKFECGEAESTQPKCTQLQGANFSGAQLQGASLLGAQLQGAGLDIARLQGAYLNEAQLQGANFSGAQLQGAYLNQAQLQGANLNQAQLQEALLSHVFVWRTTLPPDVTGAFVDAPEPRPKYSGLDCPGSKPCDWSETSYAALKSLIENSVPAGDKRDQALQRIKVLEKPSYVADEASAKAWMDLASARPPGSYFSTLAKVLSKIGCTADGAPYVIATLTPNLDQRFDDNLTQEVEVTGAFLDEAKCPGARGLSEENKAKLQAIRDRGLPASPGAAPR